MSDISPWTLSVPRRKQFSKSVARGKNCEVSGSGNVQ